MKTNQFEKLIQHITGRKLTLKTSADEIQPETKIAVYRANGNRFCFDWKTPKKVDSFLRSFITTFCAKYREPDPATYERNCSCYGDTWKRHEEQWNNLETRNQSPCWGHHASHMLSKEKLKTQIVSNFGNFTADMGKLGFYATEYGIGIFTIYGGQWVKNALDEMHAHLGKSGIPYRNEMSDAGWVTRFVIGADKSAHIAILGSF